MAGYNKGDKVEWDWGNGTGKGEITEVFTDDVKRTIGGSEIKRNATSDEPAYMIKQDDGDKVLKGHSEVRKQ